MISRDVPAERSPSAWWSVLHALGQAVANVHARAPQTSEGVAIASVQRHVSVALAARSSALVTYGPAGVPAVSVNRWPDSASGSEPPEAVHLEYLADRVLFGDPVTIRRVAALPRSAIGDRETLRRWGMRSALVMGLTATPSPMLLAVGSNAPSWPRPSVPKDVARAIADLVGNAVGRIRAEHTASAQEQELVHVARVGTLGELAVSLAHELNQPLAAIMASAEAGTLFLNADPPDVRRVRDIVRRIADEDTRAYQIITRMRTLLRRTPVETLTLRPEAVIADAVRLVEHEAMMRRVGLRVDVAPALSAIRGDPIQLQQVLINLLLNAFDAVDHRTGPPAAVSVTARVVDGGRVEIAVRDNGAGIAPDVMPRLFRPFFTTKSTGLGMGLPIIQAIIEGHGGQVFARNNPDGGATVGFVLAAAPERDAMPEREVM